MRRWHVTQRAARDAELILSELVANAVQHAAAPVRVWMTRTPGMLHLAVSDASPQPPHPRPASPDDPLGGRGLPFLQAVAEHWGVSCDHHGKSIWCAIPTG
jgi:anti-sigma regulatory factor (Ser/Thr protein kinase)